MTENNNPLGLRGIEFAEFASPDTDYMDQVFRAFGFSKVKRHESRSIGYKLDRSVIDTLDIHEDSYRSVFDRVPNVSEDHQHIKDHQVLVDGDDDGYLLQIFTRNLFGPTNHEIIQSTYFFDPNGHRLELTCVTATDEMMTRLDAVKWDMLEEWSKTKRAPEHAAWLHQDEFNEVN